MVEREAAGDIIKQLHGINPRLEHLSQNTKAYLGSAILLRDVLKYECDVFALLELPV